MFGQATLRWNTIATMARKNKGPHKLFASGAHPVVTYSAEIMGMAKPDLAKLRTRAAAATRYNQARRCATTLLRILGIPDPELRLRRQQVQTWIQTWSTAEKELK